LQARERSALAQRQQKQAGSGVCSEPQPSVGAQREGGGEDYQEPRSQAQLNRAAFDLIELLPSFGAEFSPIFNQHEAETDVGSQSAG